MRNWFLPCTVCWIEEIVHFRISRTVESFFKMSPRVSLNTRGPILALRDLNLSYCLIVKELTMSTLAVSKSTVSTVLQNVNNGTPDPSIDQPQRKKSRRPHLQTLQKVKKVTNFIASDSLIYWRAMSKSVGVFQRSINCLIHGPLKQRELKNRGLPVIWSKMATMNLFRRWIKSYCSPFGWGESFCSDSKIVGRVFVWKLAGILLPRNKCSPQDTLGVDQLAFFWWTKTVKNRKKPTEWTF